MRTLLHFTAQPTHGSAARAGAGARGGGVGGEALRLGAPRVARAARCKHLRLKR